MYFLGRKDTPLQSHLYCASTRAHADPATLVRLTQEGFDHSVVVSGWGTHFVDTFSSLSVPYKTALFALVWNDGPDQVFPTLQLASYGAEYR